MRNVLMLISTLLLALPHAAAQGAPDVVWEAPTPSGLANSVLSVSWSPTANRVAFGSTDRWFRMRDASAGALLYSVLQPLHSHGVGEILHSIDGTLVGVRNQSGTLTVRVQRANDGVFLGKIEATVGANEVVTFAPDPDLLASTGDATLSNWRLSDVTVFRTTGSGYQTVTTSYDISPDSVWQTVTRQNHVFVLRRSDGALVFSTRPGAKVEFSPDSGALAVWSSTPTNEVVLFSTADWSVLQRFPTPNALEGISAVRFTLDGQRIVTTGYSPFVDPSGAWQQNGVIRFWDVASGLVAAMYDQGLDLGVTSPVAWSPDGLRFAYGLYDGTVAVANTP
jgi:WD40 repeat protein